MERPLEIIAFLDHSGWADASMQALNGDFSTRRYARLTKHDGATAFLMDANADQKTPQFLAVVKILAQAGLNVPEIYAALPDRGLVLMQDFGDSNVGALLDQGRAATPYFLRAAETIATLHQNCNVTSLAAVELPMYHSALFTEQACLFLDGYFPLLHGREVTELERSEFDSLWKTVLRPLDKMPKNILLRDFMPDNLMELPDGGIGVLDFQDAGIGCVAYDLASLCEEVRRDGGYAQLSAVITRYLEMMGASFQQELSQACTVLSAQRHTRILGIISRIAVRTQQRDKLAYVPRIKRHLQNILQEPILSPVRKWMENYGVLSQDLV